jgi:ribosome-associated protein
MRSSTNKHQEAQAIDIEKAVKIAARAAGEKKATDIVVLDLRKIASFTEYFVISSGASTRQVAAIAEAIEDGLRKEGKRPLHTEGYSSAEWILLDYGDFIVHVFSNAARRFYDLERLWRDAGRVDIEGEGEEVKQ